MPLPELFEFPDCRLSSVSGGDLSNGYRTRRDGWGLYRHARRRRPAHLRAGLPQVFERVRRERPGASNYCPPGRGWYVHYSASPITSVESELREGSRDAGQRVELRTPRGRAAQQADTSWPRQPRRAAAADAAACCVSLRKRRRRRTVRRASRVDARARARRNCWMAGWMCRASMRACCSEVVGLDAADLLREKRPIRAPARRRAGVAHHAPPPSGRSDPRREARALQNFIEVRGALGPRRPACAGPQADAAMAFRGIWIRPRTRPPPQQIFEEFHRFANRRRGQPAAWAWPCRLQRIRRARSPLQCARRSDEAAFQHASARQRAVRSAAPQ